MIKFEQGKLVVEVETTSPAEDYYNTNQAMSNLLIAAAEKGDRKSIIEVLNFKRSLMLNVEQIQKIIDLE